MQRLCKVSTVFALISATHKIDDIALSVESLQKIIIQVKIQAVLGFKKLNLNK